MSKQQIDELHTKVRGILQKPAAKMWNTGHEEHDDLPSYEQMIVEFIEANYTPNEEVEARCIEAVRHTLKNLKSIEYPPSGKEYYFHDGSWTNSVTSAASDMVAQLKQGGSDT